MLGIEFDQRDDEIISRRAALLIQHTKPQSGDFVIFADDVTRRISHVWDWPADDEGPRLYSIQTSDGGNWHLGDGYASFSGSLFTGFDGDTLTDTGETRPGSVWIFHHDIHVAHSAVQGLVDFRVWRTTEKATR